MYSNNCTEKEIVKLGQIAIPWDLWLNHLLSELQEVTYMAVFTVVVGAMAGPMACDSPLCTIHSGPLLSEGQSLDGTLWFYVNLIILSG